MGCLYFWNLREWCLCLCWFNFVLRPKVLLSFEHCNSPDRDTWCFLGMWRLSFWRLSKFSFFLNQSCCLFTVPFNFWLKLYKATRKIDPTINRVGSTITIIFLLSGGPWGFVIKNSEGNKFVDGGLEIRGLIESHSGIVAIRNAAQGDPNSNQLEVLWIGEHLDSEFETERERHWATK